LAVKSKKQKNYEEITEGFSRKNISGFSFPEFQVFFFFFRFLGRAYLPPRSLPSRQFDDFLETFGGPCTGTQKRRKSRIGKK